MPFRSGASRLSDFLSVSDMTCSKAIPIRNSQVIEYGTKSPRRQSTNVTLRERNSSDQFKLDRAGGSCSFWAVNAGAPRQKQSRARASKGVDKVESWKRALILPLSVVSAGPHLNVGMMVTREV